MGYDWATMIKEFANVIRFSLCCSMLVLLECNLICFRFIQGGVVRKEGNDDLDQMLWEGYAVSVDYYFTVSKAVALVYVLQREAFDDLQLCNKFGSSSYIKNICSHISTTPKE